MLKLFPQLALLLAVAEAVPPHRDVILGEVEDSEDSEGDLETDEPHHDGPPAFPGVPHVRHSRQLDRPAPPSVRGVNGGSVGDTQTRPLPVKTGGQAGNGKQTANGKVNPKSGGNVKQANKKEVNKKPQNKKKNQPNSQNKPKTPTAISNSQSIKPNNQLSNDDTKTVVVKNQGILSQGSPSKSDVLKKTSIDSAAVVPGVATLGGQTGIRNLIGQNIGVSDLTAKTNGEGEGKNTVNLNPGGSSVPVQTGSGLLAPMILDTIAVPPTSSDSFIQVNQGSALAPQSSADGFNFGSNFKTGDFMMAPLAQ